jgi:2-amino-4-hydroxy-6-hydroxymethyldihydropteridine diphosphokinase
MQTEEVFIGLGSNLGDSATIIEQALSALDNVNQCSLHARSSLYRSAALGDSPQDDYINAVARVDTSLEPMALLLELQAIEQAYYRQRDPQRRWASRTLDLDIILFGNRIVLEPMFEIDGDRFIPGQGSLSYLIEHAPELAMQKLV